MKSLILAAGYAKRLFPLTLNIPKPLLKIGDSCMIDYIINKIEPLVRRNIIDKTIVITNNKFFEIFRQWAKYNDSRFKLELISDNTNNIEEKLGAVGTIDYAIRNQKIDEDLLVIAGDNLFEFSLEKMYDFFIQKKASVMAIYDIKNKEKAAGKFGVVEIDEKNRIIGFEEKPENPKTSLAATACYFLSKEDVNEFSEYIRLDNKPDNIGDFIKYLSSKKPVYAFTFDEEWYDIGSIEQLIQVDRLYSRKENSFYINGCLQG